MQVVYIDTLFLLNAIVDYMLLLAAARLAGEPLRRVRFGLGSVFGGAYAAAIFFPSLSFLVHPAYRIISAVFMLLIAYGGSRRLLRQCLIFFALACAFGGGVVAIGLLGKSGLSMGQSGIFYSALDLKIILLSAAGCYLVMTAIFQGVGRHTTLSGGVVPVTLSLGQRTITLSALLDTGNTLTHPVSGQAVMVAEAASIAALFPREYRPTHADLLDPTSAVQRLSTGEWRGRFMMLPFRAVGVERGFLLAVRMDGIFLHGKPWSSLLVALSPTPVSDGGGYRALISPLN